MEVGKQSYVCLFVVVVVVFTHFVILLILAWTSWSGYGECSKSCGGGGLKTRTRRCRLCGDWSLSCSGSISSSTYCYTQACGKFAVCTYIVACITLYKHAILCSRFSLLASHYINTLYYTLFAFLEAVDQNPFFVFLVTFS